MLSQIKSCIQYVSDLHLEKGFKRLIKPSRPTLLLGGDIGHPRDNDYKKFVLDMADVFDNVCILTGNHEYIGMQNSVNECDDRIENICVMRNNLHFLQKKTFKIGDNLHVAGCTFWSLNPICKRQYHLDHKEWIENILETNPSNDYVIATHHAPLFQCVNKKYKSNQNYFASDQSELIKNNNNLKAWIHGHTHTNKDFTVYGKWILSNQYGSYENPLFKYN